jgi:glutamate synthase (NADPH/NADH) large chain
VNASALSEGELDLLPLDERDQAQVFSLLERHALETGSKLAERMIADFSSEVGHFTKLLPRDYAKVLAIQAKATAAGEDLNSPVVWERILEVNARG